jgi:hypothetical protein
MDVHFDEEVQWHARGGIIGWVKLDDRDVRYFVTREFLHDAFGGDGSKNSALEKFSSNRSRIEAYITALLQRGAIQPVEGQSFGEVQLSSEVLRKK